jgi:uncharacterized glyoxalase superfamily protein PhnB
MAATAVFFHAVAPIVAVNDLTQALDFYGRVLGFKIAWQSGQPATLASVCREGVELNLTEAGFVPGGMPSRMYIRIVGVETFYNHLVTAGVEPEIPLAARPYGMRDFRIVDPSGNELSFGEPVAVAALAPA